MAHAGLRAGLIAGGLLRRLGFTLPFARLRLPAPQIGAQRLGEPPFTFRFRFGHKEALAEIA